MKSDVSGELTLEIGTEVVVRVEEGRRVADVFIDGNIWVARNLAVRESTVMKQRDACVRAVVGGWAVPKRCNAEFWVGSRRFD